MRKLMLFGIIILYNSILFAKSPEAKPKMVQKIYGDTISNLKVFGGATYVCSEKKCLGNRFQKVERLDPATYMILYKINKTDFVKVQRGTP